MLIIYLCLAFVFMHRKDISPPEFSEGNSITWGLSSTKKKHVLMAPISKQCFFFIITLTCCQKIHMVKCSQRDSSAFLALQRSRLRRLAIGSERQDFHSTPSFMKVTGPQHFKSLPLLMSVSLSV